MGRHAVIFVAVALVLAGCGGQGGTPTTPTSEASPSTETTAAIETTATTTTATETTATETTATETTTTETSSGDANDGTTTSSETGSELNFYLSDEQNAMGDFAHLNVTVSKVGIKSAGGGNANWTTFDVDARTVDLTELLGANATRLGTFPVERGTYETVFIHVSEVNGTLENGETVRVKLPSEKLQIHQTFEVGPNRTVDYVFDISVFEAGKSGKYILKPVISESGTDKEIEVVDEKEEDHGQKKDDEAKNGTDDRDDDNRTEETENASTLNATFVGNVTRGENATVAVTHNGSAVANATVSVNGEPVGKTDANGTFTFSMPDSEDLEVEVETEDGTATLETHFGKDDRADGDGNSGNGNGGGN